MIAISDSILKRRNLLWSCVVALLLIYPGKTIVSVLRAQTPTYVRYTVFRTENVYDKAGKLQFANTYVEAVRSDGSRMWRGATGKSQQRKIFFANGDEVRIDEQFSRKSTYPRHHQGPHLPRVPQNACASEEDSKAGWIASGTEMIGTHRSSGFVREIGRRTMRSWYALDEGCALIRLRFEHEDGVTQQDASALIMAEPDQSLFEVGASLHEVPPSLLFDACSNPGSSCTHVLPDDVKQRLDRNYYATLAKAK